MAKTVEQRTKELVDSTTTSSLLATWNGIISDTPDLNAPIYKRQGDMAGLAKKYDDAAAKFIKAAKRKDDAKKLFATGAGQLDKLRTQSDGLKKELEDASKDEGKSLQTVDDAKKVEDLINNWEEAIKAQTDLNKERKTIYDNLGKVGDNYLKGLTDTVGKVKKEVEAAKAELNSTNGEMNALEAQVRATSVKYQKIAIDSNKKDVADAARGIVTFFGK